MSSATAVEPVAATKVTPAPRVPPNPGRARWLRLAAPLGAAAIFGVALLVVERSLRGVSYGTLWHAILSLPPGRIAASLALTILCYVILTGYDVLALRHVGHDLDYPRTGLASFIGFAFSNSVGLAFLTGATVRTRLYSAWGLSTPVIARIVVFGATTLWLGVLTITGVTLVLEPAGVAPSLHLPAAAATGVGLLCLGLVAAYFGWIVRWRRPLTVLGWCFHPPSLAIALGQLAVSSLEWLTAAAALYVLLPSGTGLAFPAFAGRFVVAQAAGLVSHVPGGLGVFEGGMLLLSGGAVAVTSLVSALAVFRGFYYVLPLLTGTVVLAGLEGLRQRQRLSRVSRAVAGAVPALAAPMLALLVFTTGAVLLLSGATPTAGWRLNLLRHTVPLPLLEASHFVGSLVGMALLLLAHGLYRRMNAAWGLTVAVLAAAAFTSVIKGLDFGEASLALAALAALLPARARFYRHSSLLDEPWSAGWIVAVAVALGTSVWLGLFAYRHVEYSSHLWWQFEFRGNAPRFLRATVGAASLALLLAAVRLLRPARPAPRAPTPEDLERASRIVADSDRTRANLALLGDKSLLFDERDTAFLMYGVQGRTWAALGDPVGHEESATELAWRFRELCDRQGGWPVFYEVGRDRLPLYVEQGLTLLKLGEEARVPLAPFSLEGSHRSSLRRLRSAAERAGCALEVLPPGASDALLPELERISDDWLAAKRTREKRFSLGRFDPAYVRRFPLALVRSFGHPVAFATLLTTASRAELSLDLMRYAEDAPPSTMTYLLVQLMLWGRQQGYAWFNLGMAPLAGLQNRALAPLWTRAGAFLFVQGESFYNFKGLRDYKARFDPVWEPRYLASPGGLALPFILADIAALVGGGYRGVFTK